MEETLDETMNLKPENQRMKVTPSESQRSESQRAGKPKGVGKLKEKAKRGQESQKGSSLDS